MMNTDQEQNSLLSEAANAAIHWARTDTGYFPMRNKVKAYLQAYTSDKEPGLWYNFNSRKLAIHDLMFKCISPLKPSQYQKLDREIRDIAATLPENSVRHLRQ